MLPVEFDSVIVVFPDQPRHHPGEFQTAFFRRCDVDKFHPRERAQNLSSGLVDGIDELFYIGIPGIGIAVHVLPVDFLLRQVEIPGFPLRGGHQIYEIEVSKLFRHDVVRGTDT